MHAALIASALQYGIPAAIRIFELLVKQEPGDVKAAEWLSLLNGLKSYTDLRNELVKPHVSVTPT